MPKGEDGKYIRKDKYLKLSERLPEGPFESKEVMWSALDEFLVLQAELQAEGYRPVAPAEAAAHFKMTLAEMNKVLSSPMFVRFVDGKAKMQAKLATRVLDPLFIKKLARMGDESPENAADRDDKEFVKVYTKRFEQTGFTDTDMDLESDLDENEGMRLLNEFSEICGILYGTKPDVYKVLPRLLGARSDGQGKDDGVDTATSLGVGSDSVPEQGGPNPTMDSVPEAGSVSQKP